MARKKKIKKTVVNGSPLFGKAEIPFEDKLEDIKKKEDKGLKDPYNNPIHFLMLMFNNDEIYDTIPDSVKSKHSFVVLNKLATIMPHEVVKYSQSGINQAAVMDMLRDYLSNKYNGNIPREVWTSSKRIKNNDNTNFSISALDLYQNDNMLGTRDMNELIKSPPSYFIRDMEEYEDIVKNT